MACAFNDQPETLIRGGCTDFTFRSPSCPQFLLDVNPGKGGQNQLSNDGSLELMAVCI